MLKKGSDPTAAGGGGREGSKWPRSAAGKLALAGAGCAGHRNRGFPRQCAHWLGMTDTCKLFDKLELHTIKKIPARVGGELCYSSLGTGVITGVPSRFSSTVRPPP